MLGQKLEIEAEWPNLHESYRQADFDAAMALDLRARGHRKDVPGITGLDFGGAYVLQCFPDHVYVAASDPRRDGAAVGF